MSERDATTVPTGDIERGIRALTEERDALAREREDGLEIIRDLRQKLAEAGVEGSPPPWPTMRDRLNAAESRLAALRAGLRAVIAMLEESLTKHRATTGPHERCEWLGCGPVVVIQERLERLDALLREEEK